MTVLPTLGAAARGSADTEGLGDEAIESALDRTRIRSGESIPGSAAPRASGNSLATSVTMLIDRTDVDVPQPCQALGARHHSASAILARDCALERLFWAVLRRSLCLRAFDADVFASVGSVHDRSRSWARDLAIDARISTIGH